MGRNLDDFLYHYQELKRFFIKQDQVFKQMQTTLNCIISKLETREKRAMQWKQEQQKEISVVLTYGSNENKVIHEVIIDYCNDLEKEGATDIEYNIAHENIAVEQILEEKSRRGD